MTSQSSGPVPTALTYLTTQLGTNVAIPATNTFTDVLSLALTPGTWVVFAVVSCTDPSVGGGITVRINDGTTSYASAEGLDGFAAGIMTLPLTAVVAAVGALTLKVQAASAQASTIRATTTENPAGNTATTLTAVKIV